MLPIAGFDHFDDDYLLNIDDVIQAINQISLNTLNINIVIELERKELIKTILHQEQYAYRLAWLLQGVEIPEFRRCITKREALKLLDIASNKKEPKEDTNQKHDSKALALVLACMDVYEKGNNGEKPVTAQQLLAYCMKHKVQGYSGLTKEKGGTYQRLVWKGGSIAARYFSAEFKRMQKEDI